MIKSQADLLMYDAGHHLKHLFKPDCELSSVTTRTIAQSLINLHTNQRISGDLALQCTEPVLTLHHSFSQGKACRSFLDHYCCYLRDFGLPYQ